MGVDNVFTCGSCRHDFSHVRITFRHGSSPNTKFDACSYFSRNFLISQVACTIKGRVHRSVLDRRQKLSLHNQITKNCLSFFYSVRFLKPKWIFVDTLYFDCRMISVYACCEFPAKDPSVFSSTFARWVPTSEVEHTV